MAGLDQALPLLKGRASRAAIIVHLNFLFASVKCISHWLGFVLCLLWIISHHPKNRFKINWLHVCKKQTGENFPKN